MANALESASLVMIPSGYEDGTLGSLKPTDGIGDFTFSRGSDISATRVNADGYIEKGYENLLLQSNSFTTSPWVLNVGATLGSRVTDPNGGNDAWEINFTTNTSSRIEQQLNVINGGVYTFSVYMRVASGTQTIKIFTTISGGGSAKTLTDQWQRIELFGVSNGYTIAFPQLRNDTGIAYTAQIYAAQYNQGLVAYPYKETTTAPVAGGILEDMPRLDYSNGSCPALLLEPQRTNLVGYSEYLLDGWVDTGCTITKTSETNPSGKDISYFATAISNPTADRIRYFGGTKTGDYCFSLFAKGDGNANQIYLRALGHQSGTASNMFWDVAADGTISFNATDSDANGSPITENYGNGWYRIGFKQTFTGANAYSDIRPSKGDINAGIYVWGVQWEAGSYPTSYIPTYGVSQTRLADETTASNVASLLSESEGTLYLEVKSFPDNQSLFSISDGSISNRIGFYYQNGADLRCNIRINDLQTNLAGGGNISDGFYKIAATYDNATGLLKMFVNGILINSVSYSGGITSTLNTIDFAQGNQVSNARGIYNQALVFPTALTDSECIELTTI